jgi:DNA-binding transcriptional LysR family regulator
MVERQSPAKGNSGLPAIDLVSVTQGLVVAECLSFRRAARVLGTQQSAISRRVRALEDVLGVSLFERNPAGVRPTTAGAQFFEQARDGLRQLDDAVKTAGAAGRGVIGHLHVGILSSMAAGFLREVIRTFHAGHADVALHILEGASREQITLVRENRLDVAFVLGAPDLPNCNVTQLWTEHIFAALPQGHTLCDCDEITWESLRYEKVILCQSELGGAIHDRLITRFAELGYSPCVERLDVGREALMHLVALGLGVSFTSEATVATQFPEVVFRPIAGDAARIPFSAVSLPNNDNPAFRRFLSLARAMAKKWEHQPGDAAVRHSPKHEKSKSISNARHSHVVRTTAQSADVKRQQRRDKQLNRSKRSPARASGAADRNKRRPANRR